MLLLALLAVCGYAGASQNDVQAVSLPVTYETISAWELSGETMESVRERLAQEREREIALLDSVIENPEASSALVAQALAQKTQLTERMETEAQTRAALAYMGYAQVGVISGTDMLTLITPWQYVQEEQDRVRLIDTAAGQAQISPEYVKIILSKNE